MRKKKQIEELELKEEALITLEDFALDFANLRLEQNQVSKRTYDDYLTIIKRIHPYIGELPLTSITPRDIDNMYRTMQSTHNKNLG